MTCRPIIQRRGNLHLDGWGLEEDQNINQLMPFVLLSPRRGYLGLSLQTQLSRGTELLYLWMVFQMKQLENNC